MLGKETPRKKEERPEPLTSGSLGAGAPESQTAKVRAPGSAPESRTRESQGASEKRKKEKKVAKVRKVKAKKQKRKSEEGKMEAG